MEKEDMISIREYEDRKTEERGWTDAFSAAVACLESEGGGTLVACGTPEEVAQNPASYTGQYLRRMLQKGQKDITSVATQKSD